jgi:hypothetical protein
VLGLAVLIAVVGMDVVCKATRALEPLALFRETLVTVLAVRVHSHMGIAKSACGRIPTNGSESLPFAVKHQECLVKTVKDCKAVFAKDEHASLLVIKGFPESEFIVHSIHKVVIFHVLGWGLDE